MKYMTSDVTEEDVSAVVKKRDYAIRYERRSNSQGKTMISVIFAYDNTYYKPKDNGAGRFTICANGKAPCIFFDRPASVGSKARIRFCLEAIRFVGKEPTPKVLQKSLQI